MEVPEPTLTLLEVAGIIIDNQDKKGPKPQKKHELGTKMQKKQELKGLTNHGHHIHMSVVISH